MNAPVQQIAERETNVLKTKLSNLPEKPDGLAMPLVELNELQTVFVRPHCTRQLWFTVQTHGLTPGTTQHNIPTSQHSAPQHVVLPMHIVPASHGAFLQSPLSQKGLS